MSQANTEHAKILGNIAFAKGIKCAPVLDSELLNMFAGRQLGDARTVLEMNAWKDGWTKANLTA